MFSIQGGLTTGAIVGIAIGGVLGVVGVIVLVVIVLVVVVLVVKKRGKNKYKYLFVLFFFYFFISCSLLCVMQVETNLYRVRGKYI